MNFQVLAKLAKCKSLREINLREEGLRDFNWHVFENIEFNVSQIVIQTYSESIYFLLQFLHYFKNAQVFIEK